MSSFTCALCCSSLWARCALSFSDFRFVSRLGLRKEVAIQMLDLREAVWNEGIEPTHRARK